MEKRGLLEKQRILEGILTKERALGISKVILLSLLAAGVVTLAITAPGALRIFQPFIGRKYKKRNVAKTKETLYALKSQKLITIKYTRNGWIIHLTEKGKEKALKFYLKAFYLKHKKWDSKWRIVVFDIPVTMNRKRDALREFLKNAGFREVQKSIYAFPYPCREELDALLEYLQLERYVRYIEATSLTNAEGLKKSFRL